MQGFKLLARKNPNVSQLFGMVQQDLVAAGDEENLLTQQVTGRQLNMMEFQRMIEKLRHQHALKAKQKDEFNEAPKLQINLAYDHTRKDIGVLIRLNSLTKRLEVIKYLIGNWKPVTKKYSTITDQVAYVQRKLELLNEAKILHFQKRASALRQEIDEISELGDRGGGDKLQQREDQLGHNSELVSKLHASVKGAKPTVDSLAKIVDRIELKSKSHDMAAQIMISLERLETQQQKILDCVAKDNAVVLETLQKGIKEN